MTKDLKSRIDRLVGENLELKRVVEEAEEKMRSNRRELGRIMKGEDIKELRLENATLKLVSTRNRLDYEYLKSLPGFQREKFWRQMACIPYAMIGKPKPESQNQ